jgi:hypothetical protein
MDEDYAGPENTPDEDRGLFSGAAFPKLLLHMFGDNGLDAETEGLTVREAYFEAGLKINHLTVHQVTLAAMWVSRSPCPGYSLRHIAHGLKFRMSWPQKPSELRVWKTGRALLHETYPMARRRSTSWRATGICLPIRPRSRRGPCACLPSRETFCEITLGRTV